MKNPEYDWIVVGAGAAGISIAEMLSRMGLSVLLLEKNSSLASETSGIFHEWLHTGALYTLVPDHLKTTRYLLGAIDDLIEYYSGFVGMNLIPTEKGFTVNDKAWFNSENILYKYRARPFNPLWSMAVARAKWLVKEIENHDWLRQRAGSIHDGFRFSIMNILNNFPAEKTGFTHVDSPDVTINSRVLLTDLLNAFELSNGKIKVSGTVNKIVDYGSHVDVISEAGTFRSRHVAICCADGLSKFTDAKVKISYTPMFVINGIDDTTGSFVELDYHIKSCINLINKGGGYGLAGGISVEREDQINDYYKYCVDMHQKRNPSLKVLDMYLGLKKELVGKGQDRNYLYHINPVSANVYGVILGKFTLMFSLGPEFIRRVYHKNPPRTSPTAVDSSTIKHPLLSNARWKDIVLKQGEIDGNN